MATSKYIQIDTEEFKVPLLSPMERKGDILDLTANRSEDGVLHRDVIGTYYNYTLNFIFTGDAAEYEKLWVKLTEPVASHMVQLPYQSEAFEGYFGSCKDNVTLITAEGIKAKGLSCNLVCTRPSVTPTSNA